MKKLMILGIIGVITLLLGISFAPVDSDAKACAGGFKSYLVQKESDTWMTLFTSIQGIEGEITDYIMSWSGRDINVSAQILGADNKVYAVNYEGKRYWTEKYNWKIESISLCNTKNTAILTQ